MSSYHKNSYKIFYLYFYFLELNDTIFYNTQDHLPDPYMMLDREGFMRIKIDSNHIAFQTDHYEYIEKNESDIIKGTTKPGSSSQNSSTTEESSSSFDIHKYNENFNVYYWLVFLFVRI